MRSASTPSAQDGVTARVIVFAHGVLYMYSNRRSPLMLALRLPPEIEERLDALAKKTGRSKSYYAREAILRQIEDIEDDYLARRRLARGGSRVTLESLERALKRRTKR
jgi:RHH-type transcriptional regulator, rel operon repressor / antitoxin RelB